MQKEIVELAERLRDIRNDYWLNETLFSINWWILFFTAVSVLVIWILILDKKRIIEIIAYGLMVTITGIMLDTLGVSLLLWRYPHTLIPFPILAEIHFIHMPIIFMIIYQYFNTWKTFLIAATVNAFVFAFIFEPLLVWLHIYEPYQWKHIYSFFPYIFIAIVFKWVIYKFKQLEKRYGDDNK
ncbi:CBO0543 family protein [Virgibacillus sp. W0181]|uniref:CBO0543 family protein n=1 Tax=Virgibacillus sp. W0181 TaxID=3391581 RepID=UPI003F487C3E